MDGVKNGFAFDISFGVVTKDSVVKIFDLRDTSLPIFEFNVSSIDKQFDNSSTIFTGITKFKDSCIFSTNGGSFYQDL